MTAPVLDFNRERAVRRDAELRERFDIRPGENWQPVGMLAQRIVDDVRIQMAERRNRDARR